MKRFSREVLAGGLLVFLAVLPYLRGIDFSFVYDDHGQILENTYLQQPAHLHDILTLQTLADAQVINGRRPLVLLSYFLDKALWGDEPAGYHLTNMLWHALAMLMFFLLLLNLFKTGRGLWTCWGMAALTALHPAMTEAVQVPAFRPDIFCAAFLLFFLWAGTKQHAGGKPAAVLLPAAGLAALFLALMAKESAMVAPALLILIWCLLPACRPSRTAISGWLTGCVLICGGVLCLWLQGSGFQAAGSEWNGLSYRPPENLWSMGWVFLNHLKVLLIPYPLIIDRMLSPVSAGDWQTWLGWLSLAAVIVAAWCQRRHTPAASLGLGWIFILFLPVSNLLPLFNPVADRYLYLEVMGFIIAAGAYLFRKNVRHPYLVPGALAVFYLLTTVSRIGDYRNDIALWEATLRTEPNSARAHTWSGYYKEQQGKTAEALIHYHTAAALNPQQVSALINSAIIYNEAGEPQLAMEQLEKAIDRRPGHADAWWNYAVALSKLEREQEAYDAVIQTLELKPDHLKANRALAVMAYEKQDYTLALQAVEQLIDLEPAKEEHPQALLHIRGLLSQ